VVRKLPRPARNRPGRDGNLFVLSHASHERLSHATVRQLGACVHCNSLLTNCVVCYFGLAAGFIDVSHFLSVSHASQARVV
jgi:hypothetical protein